jgi:hypothetical protein
MLELILILLVVALLVRESPRIGGCIEILLILCLLPLVLMFIPIWIVIIAAIVLASAGH